MLMAQNVNRTVDTTDRENAAMSLVAMSEANGNKEEQHSEAVNEAMRAAKSLWFLLLYPLEQGTLQDILDMEEEYRKQIDRLRGCALCGVDLRVIPFRIPGTTTAIVGEKRTELVDADADRVDAETGVQKKKRAETRENTFLDIEKEE